MCSQLLLVVEPRNKTQADANQVWDMFDSFVIPCDAMQCRNARQTHGHLVASLLAANRRRPRCCPAKKEQGALSSCPTSNTGITRQQAQQK